MYTKKSAAGRSPARAPQVITGNLKLVSGPVGPSECHISVPGRDSAKALTWSSEITNAHLGSHGKLRVIERVLHEGKEEGKKRARL